MFERTTEQRLLADSTSRFLDDAFSPAQVRQLSRSGAPVSSEMWRAGVSLGWTSLLVPEACGGGAVSDNGVADVISVAAAFGQHAAPGPLFGSAAIAMLCGAGKSGRHDGFLVGLMDGELTAAWDGHSAVGQSHGCPSAVRSGPSWRLSGTAEAEAAALVLVAAADESDESGVPVWFLVPTNLPGIACLPLDTVDLTRKFVRYRFHDVELPEECALDEGAKLNLQRALDVIVLLCAAEISGAVGRSLELTRRWVCDRFSFGRPLGSYQAIKHRLADDAMHLEACMALTERAATALGNGAQDAPSWVYAAKAYASRYGPEVIQDCVQIHGGIGVTFEHDLHLYLRRATLDAAMYGGFAGAERRLAQLTLEGQAA